MTLRICAYPGGCDASINHRHGAAKYCRLHALEMALKHKRGQNPRSRPSEAKPGTRKVYSVTEGTPARKPEPKCSICGSIPSARTPDRTYEALKGGRQRNGVQLIVAPNWVCVGCGGLYAPEPPINLGSAVRSSMGATTDYGRYYGGEATVRNPNRTPTGRRKGASK